MAPEGELCQGRKFCGVIEPPEGGPASSYCQPPAPEKSLLLRTELGEETVNGQQEEACRGDSGTHISSSLLPSGLCVPVLGVAGGGGEIVLHCSPVVRWSDGASSCSRPESVKVIVS